MLEAQLRRSEQQHSQALDQLNLACSQVGTTGLACMCMSVQVRMRLLASTGAFAQSVCAAECALYAVHHCSWTR